MKKLIFASALLAAAMTSCSDDVESVSQNADNQLQFSARVEGNQSRANSTATGWGSNKTAFSNGDEIGLFVYKENWGTLYDKAANHNGGGKVPVNVKATKQNDQPWLLDPAVNLTKDKAQIWAYWPYASASQNQNGKEIPVDLTKDYLYGTNGSANISNANPKVSIQMKHALTQFVLRLNPSPDYTNNGKLTKIELRSSSSTLAQHGQMDISSPTGAIKRTDASPSIEYNGLSADIQPDGESKDYVAMLFPMTAEEVKDITLYLTIDDVIWKYQFKANEWKAGKKNIYNLTMKSDAIVIGGKNGNDITIENWADNLTGEAIELTPAP